MEIEDLPKQCTKIICQNLTDDCLLDTRSFAKMKNFGDLASYCDKAILERFESLFREYPENVLEMSATDLVFFFTHDRLNASEEFIWGCIMQWVQTDLPMRKKHFPDLFQSIRLPHMDKAFFRESVRHHEFVYGYRQCNDHAKNAETLFSLIEEWIHWQCNHHALGEIYEYENAETLFGLIEDWIRRDIPVALPNMSMASNFLIPPPRIPSTLVVILGGLWSSQMHAYDSRADCWKELLPDRMKNELEMHRGMHRGSYGCAMISKTSAIIAGGYTEQGFLRKVGIIDFERLEYKEIAPMANVRGCFSCVTLGGKVYALGGLNNPGCDVLDMERNQWTKIATFSIERRRCCASSVNGKIHVVGGYTEPWNEELTSIEVYDEVADSWEVVGNMNTGRYDASCCEWRGKLIIAGGEANNGMVLNSVEAYDPVSKECEYLPPMRSSRSVFCLTVVDGGLLAIGGVDEDGFRTNTVEFYDPVKGRWEWRAYMADPISDHGAICLNTIDLSPEVVHQYLTLNREQSFFEKNNLGRFVEKRSSP